MAADVYAVGVVLREMQQASSGDAGFEVYWDSMVEMCMLEDPELRPTCLFLAEEFERVATLV
jgi:hypothetical protein